MVAGHVEARQLGAEAAMTRRDFVNGVLAGTALLSTAAHAPPQAVAPELGPEWTGPGGIGDYARANGNTHEVVNAAHEVRNGFWDQAPVGAQVEDTVHDLIVVGGGITGLICAWEFRENQRRMGRQGRSCLLLDNHRMFGGEAKGNVFEVDGHRLAAPQGSNATLVPAEGLLKSYWDALRIPVDYPFEVLTGATQPIRVARDHYGPMQYSAETTSLGYWFRNDRTGGRSKWFRDIWNDGLHEAPLDPGLKEDLLRWYRAEEVQVPPAMDPLLPASELLAWRRATETSGIAAWLDSMSYADYLERVMGLSPGVSRYVDPLVAVGLSGTASDAVSAYAAQRILLPGVTPHSITSSYEKRGIFASPIGNGFIARYFVKDLVPDALAGGYALEEVIDTPVDLSALDRPGAAVRIRLNATAVRVEHEGSSQTADTVRVTYLRDGVPYIARARNVIMASGGWINRYVVRDLPDDLHEAYASFANGPVLTANIALHHWRFLDRLGISGARWFEGLGFFGSIVQPVRLGAKPVPFDPGKPTVFTCYVPFLNPGLPPVAQCVLGRAQLLQQSFADLELQIRRQMQSMFGEHGFDARRDIAGLILNRWGHAYICPQPGFFFGRAGQPAPRDVVRKGYGRIAFAHAELQGNQSWASSAIEAKRASDQTAARF
jgi:spermidine dehydrogenase